MNAVGITLMSAGVGLGVAILIAGFTGRDIVPALSGDSLSLPGVTPTRIAAFASGLLVYLVSGWIAAGLLAAAAIWSLPELLGGRAARDAAIAKTEAVASWTEMVRDAIVAASGLEEAIAATGPIAPAAIAEPVQRLVGRLDPHSGIPLQTALGQFAEEVHHPSADLVVAALVLGAWVGNGERVWLWV